MTAIPRSQRGSQAPGFDQAADLDKDPAEIPDPASTKVPAQLRTTIEQAMARTIPLIISFLARLLGLGGISEKIKSIITKIQARVDAAVDKVIAKARKDKRLSFSGDPGQVVDSGDAIFICVGTPPLPNGDATPRYTAPVAAISTT